MPKKLKLHCPLCGGNLGDEKHTRDRVIQTYHAEGELKDRMWREEDYHECKNCGAKADAVTNQVLD